MRSIRRATVSKVFCDTTEGMEKVPAKGFLKLDDKT